MEDLVGHLLDNLVRNSMSTQAFSTLPSIWWRLVGHQVIWKIVWWAIWWVVNQNEIMACLLDTFSRSARCWYQSRLSKFTHWLGFGVNLVGISKKFGEHFEQRFGGYFRAIWRSLKEILVITQSFGGSWIETFGGRLRDLVGRECTNLVSVWWQQQSWEWWRTPRSIWMLSLSILIVVKELRNRVSVLWI